MNPHHTLPGNPVANAPRHNTQPFRQTFAILPARGHAQQPPWSPQHQHQHQCEAVCDQHPLTNLAFLGS